MSPEASFLGYRPIEEWKKASEGSTTLPLYYCAKLARTGLTRQSFGVYSVPRQTLASKQLACPFNQPDRVHLEHAYRRLA